jgi:hypothetical protein
MCSYPCSIPYLTVYAIIFITLNKPSFPAEVCDAAELLLNALDSSDNYASDIHNVSTTSTVQEETQNDTVLQLHGVGSDRKREKKAEKPHRKMSSVARFDAKYIDGKFFERNATHKADEEELHEVWAIEKGTGEVKIKTEPSDERNTEEDGDVQFVGCMQSKSIHTSQQQSKLQKEIIQFEKCLTEKCSNPDVVSTLKMSLDTNLAPVMSLHRAKEAQEYLNSLSPQDMTEFMTWGIDDADTAIEVKEEPVFTTPTKRGPSNIRPTSPEGRKKVQLYHDHNLGSMSTRVVVPGSSPSSPASNGYGTYTYGSLSNRRVGERVTPPNTEEFYARKKKQMDQKAKWAVANALKVNKTL